MNNIKKLRGVNKQSTIELAKALGVSQSTISKWENSKDLKYEPATIVANYYKVSTDYVLGKEGAQGEQFEKIDVIDAQACCGNGIENFYPVPIGQQMISVRALREITMSQAENIKIIKARGDSMEPTINDSDVIWVDISYKSVSGDGIYVFCIGNEMIAKRVRVNFLNNTATILSDNPHYPPISADSVDGIRVIGKVIAINKMLG